MLEKILFFLSDKFGDINFDEIFGFIIFWGFCRGWKICGDVGGQAKVGFWGPFVSNSLRLLFFRFALSLEGEKLKIFFFVSFLYNFKNRCPKSKD